MEINLYLDSLVGDDKATMKASIQAVADVEPGVDVQAYDADLTTWGAKTAPSGTVLGTTDTQTMTNKSIVADSCLLVDGTDNTKKLQVVISGFSTATTRTLTIPNTASMTMVDLASTQTLFNKKLIAGSTVIRDDSDATKGGAFLVSGITTGTTRTMTFPNANGTMMTRENAETLSAIKVFSLGTATTAQDYTQWKPTDFGTGKYQLAVAKSATAGTWSFTLWDGTDTNGRIHFTSGTFSAAGVYNTTTASAANVNVASDGTLARATSSEKYKTDIEPMADEWADKALELTPIWYRSTCEGDNKDWSWWGLSAEAVAAVDARLVHWKTHDVVPVLVEKEVPREEQYVEQEPCTILLPSISEDGEEIEVEVESTRDVLRTRTITETVEVVEMQTIALEQPEPEGVAYERLVCHLLSIVKRQNDQIANLTTRLDAIGA